MRCELDMWRFGGAECEKGRKGGNVGIVLDDQVTYFLA